MRSFIRKFNMLLLVPLLAVFYFVIAGVMFLVYRAFRRRLQNGDSYWREPETRQITDGLSSAY